MSAETSKPSVVIVGGGFAGVGCAKGLAKHDVPVTLLDQNNYHQFQPLLYQVATAELSTTDIARLLREIFKKDPTVAVKQLAVTEVDPATRTVITTDGQTFTADYLVLAAGSRPNFFNTAGAKQHSFPLYTVDDAEALRTRLFEVFEEADTNPARIDDGALNVVIVGAGRPPAGRRPRRLGVGLLRVDSRQLHHRRPRRRKSTGATNRMRNRRDQRRASTRDGSAGSRKQK